MNKIINIRKKLESHVIRRLCRMKVGCFLNPLQSCHLCCCGPVWMLKKKTIFHAQIKYFFLNNPQSDCARLSFKALQALQVLIRKFAANEFS